jgi:DNA-binding CsgD family transcriptional regulator
MCADRATTLNDARERLDALALAAPSLRAYREGALAVLATKIAFDAAIFHALSPRVPLETGAFVGLDMKALTASRARWDDLAVELGALRDLANRDGVATDRAVFAPGTRARTRFERTFVRTFGTPSVCIAHLVLRGSVRAAIVLLSRRRAGFSRESVAALKALLPAISVADALHERLDGARIATAALRLTCEDERLTERQRAIVELVAMGQRNEDIARAMGLSANTVRNHLARIFTRIGASNRAELVRLAVFTGSR